MTDDPKISFATLHGALALIEERQDCTTLRRGKPEGRALLLQAVRDVAALEAIERQLRNMAVNACNWPLTEAQEARADKRAARLGEKAADIVKPYGVKLKLGGDVRGSQVRFLTPKSGRNNTWGGAQDGWAV
jgi:hypothetical protein